MTPARSMFSGPKIGPETGRMGPGSDPDWGSIRGVISGGHRTHDWAILVPRSSTTHGGLRADEYRDSNPPPKEADDGYGFSERGGWHKKYRLFGLPFARL